MANATKSHAHSPERAEVERAGPLKGSRSSGGSICRTADAVVGSSGGASAVLGLGVAVRGVLLDNAIRAGSMSIRIRILKYE